MRTMLARIAPRGVWLRSSRDSSRGRGAAVLTALATIALFSAFGATPAAATTDRSASADAEFLLRSDSAIVGDFGGFGGQFNQHVYAKISGPPPYLPQLEERVVDLQPQLARIFFNTSEWQNVDRMDSFVHTVRLAHRAGADVNITWQGSTFTFAMQNMDRFADVLAELLDDASIDHLWVTIFNEPNTTQRTLGEYEQVYRTLHRELRSRGIRARIRFMGGDLTRSTTGPSQAEWLRYMAGSMGDLLDAWSVHVYWDFWDTGKIEDRLRSEVRTIFSTIPEEQRRPLYVTEFGVRGFDTFEGEPNFEPGLWPDGTGMASTNTSAFQHAWFNIRSAQLGYSGTVKWDVYPAKYDLGTQDFSTLGPAASGWQPRPVYNLLQLLGITTRPHGGYVAEVVAAPQTSKLVTAYVSPARDLTILGLDTTGGSISTTSHDPVSFTIRGLPPNTSFRLLVWNGDGTGRNDDRGFFPTDSSGAITLSIPLDAVFALTSTPIMELPW
jgi:hypothetical protein